MDCCKIAIFAKFRDDETGDDYLAPIEPVRCPFCGEELRK